MEPSPGGYGFPPLQTPGGYGFAFPPLPTDLDLTAVRAETPIPPLISKTATPRLSTPLMPVVAATTTPHTPGSASASTKRKREDAGPEMTGPALVPTPGSGSGSRLRFVCFCGGQGMGMAGRVGRAGRVCVSEILMTSRVGAPMTKFACWLDRNKLRTGKGHDSGSKLRPAVTDAQSRDDARLVKRHYVFTEMLEKEEGYLKDLNTVLEVSFLASVSCQSSSTRASQRQIHNHCHCILQAADSGIR